MRIPSDLELTEHRCCIHRLARYLNEPHLAEDYKHLGAEMALFMILSDIEKAAHKAQLRMNDLMYGRSFKPPEEQMGS